ncbi:hypothetical protein AUJ14_02590 [Candidatus Micrarchaeota archaeon CG1_02_55_22]|nr:MAG: hypothetical protein AUJ14_02590 [Candidatus Micrarchaeota archaeon CG1_02_55_22]
MERVIICLSGHSGAGKSTIARMLSERYGFLHVSREAQLRRIREELGKSRREALAAYVHAPRDQIEEFDLQVVQRMVQDAGNSPRVVLDFLTRPSHVAAVKQAFPDARVVTLYVSAPELLRAVSVLNRNKARVTEPGVKRRTSSVLFDFAIEHLTHNSKWGELGALAKTADYRIVRTRKNNPVIPDRVDEIVERVLKPQGQSHRP